MDVAKIIAKHIPRSHNLDLIVKLARKDFDDNVCTECSGFMDAYVNEPKYNWVKDKCYEYGLFEKLATDALLDDNVDTIALWRRMQGL